MLGQITYLRIISLAAILLAQGCVTAPSSSAQANQHIALKRWNQCLERFDKDTHHYCEGHRRDVLATFPTYLGDQINAKLNRQAALNQTDDVTRIRQLLRMDAASALAGQDTLK